MADSRDTTLSKNWATALAHYEACVDKFNEARFTCTELEEARDEAEEKLLAVAAPNLEAVAIKLRAIWADNLSMSNDPYVDLQRQLISDVERLHAEKG